MSADIFVNEITFSDGKKVKIAKKSITVFVGPNNAGKSVALTNIIENIRKKNDRGIVIKELQMSLTGDEDELIEFLKSNSKKGVDSLHYQGYQFNIYENSAKQYWNNYKDGVEGLSDVFVTLLDTQSRLGMVGPASSIALREHPQHPIHFLERSEKMQETFNKYFQKAFGTDLTLNHRAGNELPLHVGKEPIYTKKNDRISDKYNDKLEKLTFLHDQGDGMKSFVGILLSAIISYKSIFLIDEPEAFLHPPQARLLGIMFAQDLAQNKQLFLSTHSEDFLKGLLDVTKSNIKIIRINRNNTVNNITELNNKDIKKVWNDPILKHSNILSGLFHKKVIVCEGDADCRFYSAVLDSMCEDVDNYTSDTLFVHCGGKHRMPVVINSLKKIGVPVSVIVDFDILNNREPLKKIVEALGAKWDDIKDDWKLINDDIKSKVVVSLKTEDLKKSIQEYIDTISSVNISVKDADKMKNMLKIKTPWKVAKEVGKSFIPPGKATRAFMRLQKEFENVDMFIVESGELESFVRTVPKHGPSWVNEVLETKNLINDSDLREARAFIKKMDLI